MNKLPDIGIGNKIIS